MKITYNVEADKFAIFTHSIGDQPFYVGMCPIRDLFALDRYFENAGWVQYVEQHGGHFNVNVIATFTDHLTTFETLKRMLPLMQLPPVLSNKRLRVVFVCHQDGRQFKRQVDIAREYGIAQSALSAHIRGTKGYGSVQGLTFSKEYVQ